MLAPRQNNNKRKNFVNNGTQKRFKQNPNQQQQQMNPNLNNPNNKSYQGNNTRQVSQIPDNGGYINFNEPSNRMNGAGGNRNNSQNNRNQQGGNNNNFRKNNNQVRGQNNNSNNFQQNGWNSGNQLSSGGPAMSFGGNSNNQRMLNMPNLSFRGGNNTNNNNGGQQQQRNQGNNNQGGSSNNQGGQGSNNNNQGGGNRMNFKRNNNNNNNNSNNMGMNRGPMPMMLPPMPPMPFMRPGPNMMPMNGPMNGRFRNPMMGGPGFQRFGPGMRPNGMGPFANNVKNRNLKVKKVNHPNQKTPTQVKANPNAKQAKPNPNPKVAAVAGQVVAPGQGKLRKKNYNAKRKNQDKYPLDAPFVTNEMKIEHEKKEKILEQLRGKKDDVLFAVFKEQRDKFAKLYDDAKAVHLEKKKLVSFLLFSITASRKHLVPYLLSIFLYYGHSSTCNFVLLCMHFSKYRTKDFLFDLYRLPFDANVLIFSNNLRNLVEPLW